MSGGQHEAVAIGRMATELREAAYLLRDAACEADEGHRGVALDVLAEVNEILLPKGWKLVRAESVKVFR